MLVIHGQRKVYRAIWKDSANSPFTSFVLMINLFRLPPVETRRQLNY